MPNVRTYGIIVSVEGNMKSAVKQCEDEMWFELFKTTLHLQLEADQQYLDHMRLYLDFLNEMIKNKEHDEPLSIFKKRHKIWEDELDELQMKLCDGYAKLGHEFTEQQEFYYKLRGLDKKDKKAKKRHRINLCFLMVLIILGLYGKHYISVVFELVKLVAFNGRMLIGRTKLFLSLSKS